MIYLLYRLWDFGLFIKMSIGNNYLFENIHTDIVGTHMLSALLLITLPYIFGSSSVFLGTLHANDHQMVLFMLNEK